MQNIAKASQNRSISELEKVVKANSEHVAADPIVKVGINYKTQRTGIMFYIYMCACVCVCVWLING